MLYKYLRITQHMKFLTQRMTKIYTTYDQKLDNIYEFLGQHMNFLTQHMKIFIETSACAHPVSSVITNMYGDVDNICVMYTLQALVLRTPV